MSRCWGIALTLGYFALSAADVCISIGKYVHHDDLWPVWAFFATFFLYVGVQRLIRQEMAKRSVTLTVNGQAIADAVRKYNRNV